MTDSDAEIIQAVLAGDVERYAELVDKYQGPAIRLAFSVLGDYEDARDVSQDAFISAYRALGRFHGHAKFSTWLYRIVINACRNTQRRRWRQPAAARIGPPDPGDDAESLFEPDDPSADPGARARNRELGAMLSDAIGRLPLQQRTAFLLHHVHGCSLEEAAGIMTCRLGTVKSHLFRATAALRVQLASWRAQE